jgi:hypothetical protein
MLKKVLLLLRKKVVNCHVHKRPPLDITLSQMHPVHIPRVRITCLAYVIVLNLTTLIKSHEEYKSKHFIT